MAIAFVRKLATEATNTTNNTTIAMTTTAAVTAGDFIIGFVANHLGGLFVVTSVSGGGLTWSVDSTETGSSTLGVSVFSAQAPSGLASGTVITATLSGSSSRKVMGLYEFSGVATTTPKGVTTPNAGTTGSPAVTLSSAATAGDLVFAAYEHNATGTAGTQTPFAGFSSLGSAVAGTSSWTEGYAQYKVDAAGVADAAGYTPSVDTTTAWLAAAACYHAAGAGPTTFPITITVSTVSLSPTVQRLGKLNVLPTASLTATVQRLGKLNVTTSVVTTPVTVQRKGLLGIITSTVATPVTVVRKGLVGIVTSTVTLPVTVAVQLVKLITIVTGTVSLSASVQRLGKLTIKPTVSTPVTLIRKGFLSIKPTVTTPATTQRKGLLKITTGTVSTPATVARKGLLGIVASTVSLPVSLVRKGLLLIKPTVANSVTVTAVSSVTPPPSTRLVPYMNLTLISESANTIRVEEA